LWDPSFSFRACYAGADLCGLEVSWWLLLIWKLRRVLFGFLLL
jgi:hypothetical protein